MSGILHHPKLGIIKYTYRRNARSFKAWWADGILMLTIPMSASPQQATNVIEQMADRLLATRPSAQSVFLEGTTKMGDYTITVEKDATLSRGLMSFARHDTDIVVRMSPLDNLESNDGLNAFILKNVHKLVHRHTAPTLERRLREIALALGLDVPTFSLAKGIKLLGRCSIDKRVSLSSFISLLPADIRDYVICHELAHLSDFDHSQAFHNRCDSYCRTIIGREERILEAELKRELRRLKC